MSQKMVNWLVSNPDSCVLPSNLLSKIETRATAMVQEFDRKKKAFELANQSHKQTGSIDVNRIAYRKTSDNIFKKLSFQPVGKNHGVYVLIDFSTSMSKSITSVWEEAYTIVRFCERAKIPFKIVGFTTGSRIPFKNDSYGEMPFYGAQSDCKLICYMSSYKTKAENLACFRIGYELGYRTPYKKHFDMGVTPLENAYLGCYHDICKMRSDLKIENMNFVILTDGAGNSYPAMRNVLYANLKDLVFIDPFNGYKEYRFEYNDMYFRKYEKIDAFNANLLNVIRENNITVIGVYLTYCVEYSYIDKIYLKNNGKAYELTQSKKSVYCQAKNYNGHDLFIWRKEHPSSEQMEEMSVMSKTICAAICAKYSFDVMKKTK